MLNVSIGVNIFTHVDQSRVVVQRSQMRARQWEVGVKSRDQVSHFRSGDRRPDEDAAERVPDERDAGRHEGVAADVKEDFAHQSVSHWFEARKGVALHEHMIS